jgi:tetratricopeptide (TPR) repeat protein
MFKAIKFGTFLLLLLTFSNSYSQDRILDSIKTILKNPKIHDTTKLRTISETMGAKYRDNEPNYYVLNELMKSLALKNYKKQKSGKLFNSYASFLAEGYNVDAIKEERKRDFVKAFAYIDKCIALHKSAKAYEEMNFATVTKGSLYSDIQEYEKAISCMFGPLRYFEHSKGKNSRQGVGFVHTYLGQIYLKQENYRKSIAHYVKANSFYDEFPKMTPQHMHEKSYVHANIAACYFKLKDYAKALENYNEAISLCEKIGDNVTINVVLGKMAQVKMQQNKFDEAQQLLTKALQGDFNPVATPGNYLNMGELYFKKKDLNKAESYLDKGLSISQEYEQFELIKDASNLLYKVSEANKNYKKALEMYVLHDKLVDSSKTETSKNALVVQQLKYDFDKKEFNYKLASQKKTAAKNNWLIGLSGVLLLVLLGLYFYYRNNKQKQAITVLEKDQIKQKLLVSQMNPHFIFNSIENIQQLIYDKKDNDAVNYLNKFSILTRQILENSNETYISLSEEVAMTENYLAIQQLLYSNKFDFTITIEETIDADTIFLPPMLTQPFIENAIKHGLSNKDENGMIDIRFYLNNEKLFFEVLDNGKGFDASKTVGNHKSLAMTITKERLVNYTKNQDFVVQTDNIKDNDEKVIGAKVVFEIPYIYEN